MTVVLWYSSQTGRRLHGFRVFDDGGLAKNALCRGLSLVTLDGSGYTEVLCDRCLTLAKDLLLEPAPQTPVPSKPPRPPRPSALERMDRWDGLKSDARSRGMRLNEVYRFMGVTHPPGLPPSSRYMDRFHAAMNELSEMMAGTLEGRAELRKKRARLAESRAAWPRDERAAFVRSIRSRRRMLGMTQEDVARCVGASKFSVHRWEKGLNVPRASVMARLVDLLDPEHTERSSSAKVTTADER